MFGDYQIQVHETGLLNSETDQERAAQNLDESMQCSCTLHIVLGRNGADELLYVECGHDPSDGRRAMFEACGFYACRTGYWPEFFSFQCQIRRLQVQGRALPNCLEFSHHRKMLILTPKDMETHKRVMARTKAKLVIPKSRRRAGVVRVHSPQVVA